MRQPHELVALDARLAKLEEQRETARGLNRLTLVMQIAELQRRRGRLERELLGEGASSGARAQGGQR